jgi:cell division protein FtsL
MMRLGTLLWLLLVAIAGFGLFELKYRVQSQEQELARLDRQIQNDRNEIQVLRAEWAHLNDPHRLADLARRYLDLAPVAGVQIVRFETLPARPTRTAEDDAGNMDPSIVAFLSQLGGLGRPDAQVRP